MAVRLVGFGRHGTATDPDLAPPTALAARRRAAEAVIDLIGAAAATTSPTLAVAKLPTACPSPR